MHRCQSKLQKCIINLIWIFCSNVWIFIVYPWQMNPIHIKPHTMGLNTEEVHYWSAMFIISIIDFHFLQNYSSLLRKCPQYMNSINLKSMYFIQEQDTMEKAPKQLIGHSVDVFPSVIRFFTRYWAIKLSDVRQGRRVLCVPNNKIMTSQWEMSFSLQTERHLPLWSRDLYLSLVTPVTSIITLNTLCICRQ